MRHVLGVVLGLVAAALVAVGSAWGADRFRFVLASGQEMNSRAAGGLVALLAVGLLIGVLCAARWVSPMAPLIAGLALAGATAVFASDPVRFADQLPDNSLKVPIINTVGLGLYAVAGLALFTSALVPGRWRAVAADSGPGMQDQLPPWEGGARHSASSSGVDWTAPSQRASAESEPATASYGYQSGGYTGSSYSGGYGQQAGSPPGGGYSGGNGGGAEQPAESDTGSTQLFRPVTGNDPYRQDPYGR